MKKVLLVTASEMEVRLFLNDCTFLDAQNDFLKTYTYNSKEYDILVTGQGTTFTTFHLTSLLSHAGYKMIINAGLAGSLTDEIKVGDVVNVIEEEFADLGIEEEQEFLTLFDSGYIKPDEFPFENRILRSDHLPYAGHLKRVKGITTNIVHGRKSTVNELKSRFRAQVESMEGAAVFYVCRWMGVPVIQVRAISNYVAPHDDAQWDIPLALDNLKLTLLSLLQEIS